MTVFTRAPLSAVLTDKDGYVLGSTNPIPVDPAESGATTFAPSQVSVSSASATQLLALNPTRRGALITNMDASITVFIGGAGVTITTGHALVAGSSISIPTVAALYAIAASGTPKVSASEAYD